MFGLHNVGRRFRWTAVALVAALLFAAPLLLGGCSRSVELIGVTTALAPAAPVAASGIPTPEPPTTADPAATPASRWAPVTREQAEDVVRSWFKALAAGDYQRAETLTAGNGTTSTHMVTAPLQSQATQQGVQIQGMIRRLDLSAPESQPESGRAVHAEFDIDINALFGPAAVPVHTVEGGATFLVQQTDAGALISDIQDATGLPGQ